MSDVISKNYYIFFKFAMHTDASAYRKISFVVCLVFSLDSTVDKIYSIKTMGGSPGELSEELVT